MYSNINIANEYTAIELDSALFEIARTQATYDSTMRMYAEADDGDSGSKSSGGFFSKIVNFIKSLINKVIDFIKKLAKKVVEIVSMPFGSKVKAEGGGGGGAAGSSTSRSSESSSSSPSSVVTKTGSSNYTEIATLYKKILTYIKSTEVKGINEGELRSKLNKDTVGKIADSKIDFGKLYKPSDVTSAIGVIAGRFDEVTSDADSLATYFISKSAAKSNDDNKTIGEAIKKANGSVAHKVIASKFEGWKNRRDMVDSNIVLDIIEKSYVDIITLADACSSQLSSKNVTDKNLKYKAEDVIAALTAKYGKNKPTETVSDKCPFRIAGLPPQEFYDTRILSVVASAGTDFAKFITEEKIKTIKNIYNLGDYNIKSITNYAKVLTDTPVIDKAEFDKRFKSISITEGSKLVDFVKGIFGGVNVEHVEDELLNGDISATAKSILENVSKIDKDINEVNPDTNSSKKESFGSDISEKVTAKELTGLISTLGKIIKQIGNQIVPVVGEARRNYENTETLYNLPAIIVAANSVLFKWDYIMSDYKALSEKFNDKSFVERCYGKDAEAVKKAKYNLNKSREDAIKKISDLFGSRTAE